MSEAETTAKRSVPFTSAECQFALRKAIDDVRDTLIQAGAAKVALLENSPLRNGKLELSRSQMKNVVNLADSTRSREAVTNFLRYQMGREGSKPWLYSANSVEGKAFGREIIEDIEGSANGAGVIDACIETVCKAVTARVTLTPADVAELRTEASAQLVRLYLGYLNRAFAYCYEMISRERDSADCWQDMQQAARRKDGASHD